MLISINSTFFGDYGSLCSTRTSFRTIDLQIQPITEEITSELNIWFLDDGTLVGNGNIIFRGML